MAAQHDACKIVTASDYQRVLGRRPRLTPGEGISSCNVFVGRLGAPGSVFILPALNPRTPAQLRREFRNVGTFGTRIPGMGTWGYYFVETGGAPQDVMAFRHGYLLTIQATAGKSCSPTKAQMTRLGRLAYSRM